MEWDSLKPKYGWNLIAKSKQRRSFISVPVPAASGFRSFSAIERWLQPRASSFSKAVVKILDEAPHYPEGTGVRLLVKNAKDLVARFANWPKLSWPTKPLEHRTKEFGRCFPAKAAPRPTCILRRLPTEDAGSSTLVVISARQPPTRTNCAAECTASAILSTALNTTQSNFWEVLTAARKYFGWDFQHSHRFLKESGFLALRLCERHCDFRTAQDNGNAR